MVREMEQFLEDEYDMKGEAPGELSDMESFAASLVVRHDIMSWELRHMERRIEVWTGASPDDDDSAWRDGELPELPADPFAEEW
jgi:hypothetical protein